MLSISTVDKSCRSSTPVIWSGSLKGRAVNCYLWDVLTWVLAVDIWWSGISFTCNFTFDIVIRITFIVLLSICQTMKQIRTRNNTRYSCSQIKCVIATFRLPLLSHPSGRQFAVSLRSWNKTKQILARVKATRTQDYWQPAVVETSAERRPTRQQCRRICRTGCSSAGRRDRKCRRNTDTRRWRGRPVAAVSRPPCTGCSSTWQPSADSSCTSRRSTCPSYAASRPGPCARTARGRPATPPEHLQRQGRRAVATVTSMAVACYIDRKSTPGT